MNPWVNTSFEKRYWLLSSNVLAETFRAGAILVQLALVVGSDRMLSSTLCARHRCWKLMSLNSVVSFQSTLHHCSPLEVLPCPLDEKEGADFLVWRLVSWFCMMN